MTRFWVVIGAILLLGGCAHSAHAQSVGSEQNKSGIIDEQERREQLESDPQKNPLVYKRPRVAVGFQNAVWDGNNWLYAVPGTPKQRILQILRLILDENGQPDAKIINHKAGLDRLIINALEEKIEPDEKNSESEEEYFTRIGFRTGFREAICHHADCQTVFFITLDNTPIVLPDIIDPNAITAPYDIAPIITKKMQLNLKPFNLKEFDLLLNGPVQSCFEDYSREVSEARSGHMPRHIGYLECSWNGGRIVIESRGWDFLKNPQAVSVQVDIEKR